MLQPSLSDILFILLCEVADSTLNNQIIFQKPVLLKRLATKELDSRRKIYYISSNTLKKGKNI